MKDNQIMSWFKKHVATIEKCGDIEILTWKRPGTNFYYVRFVFDSRMMYVSGDLGYAVFALTWKAGVHNFNDIGLHYFEEKLVASCEEDRTYNSDKAVKRLKEWRKELINDRTIYDKEKMKELTQIADGCSRKREWAEVVNGEYNEFISELDRDYWEWAYSIGDEIPVRIRSYLIALKMASIQLKALEEFK